jgi:hypothetical protein
VTAAASYPDFAARAPWLGPDLQTLRNLLRGAARALPAGARSRRLLLPVSGGDRLSARLLEPAVGAPCRDGAPLVVLVHGLGGSEDSPYMGVSAACLVEAGFRVLQLNLRGAGPSRPLCRAQYHAGRTEDFHTAIHALPDALVADGVVGVGFSLGGNMLLKYAAEYGDLRGVVSVSAPIDLAAASQRFLAARNRIYHAYMLAGMKREALAPGAEVSDEERRLLPGIRSILEFDEKIVAPRNGFAGAADYYARNHARRFLPDIRMPALLVHALDDPWIPARSYTSFDWSSNRRLVPLLAPGGGHVGFHGRGSRTPWHDRCLRRFLEGL